ncbi:unnamed protein product [Heligmosomoides polygyrus]|uniref:Ovate family protein n=1 Tax=Heligmosomoides polygyrus TaxID=6339 RepID=A0A183G547_HELPZ|nr:unnamed protein product [Heligmosomoides polygyrus]
MGLRRPALAPRGGTDIATLYKEPSREEIKLAERMASILKGFEAFKVEVHKDEQLEVVEEEEYWNPQDELMDVESYIMSMMKRSHSHVIAHVLPFDLQQRDNILKVVSLVYRILCHPRVEKLVAYARFKSGYTMSHPGLFENPSKMVFPDVIGPCREANCEEPVGLIHRPHWDQCFCFILSLELNVYTSYVK